MQILNINQVAVFISLPVYIQHHYNFNDKNKLIIINKYCIREVSL